MTMKMEIIVHSMKNIFIILFIIICITSTKYYLSRYKKLEIPSVFYSEL